MKKQILALLRENAALENQYISGQQMCEQFGVSRTAVWKAIRSLEQEGCEIEAVTNKGYRLVSEAAADVLSQEELERALDLGTKWAGHPVYFKKKTGSTNLDIMTLAEDDAKQGTLVVTTQQTAGRGRRGRTWESPQDGNVYMSILLRPQMRPEQAPMTTLVMALAVYQACKHKTISRNVRFGIKWPNDIVVSVDKGPYKKVCGILTEMRMVEMEIKDVTVGIGLNCNMKKMPEELKETATTIGAALGGIVNRCELISAIWYYFEKAYEDFEKAGNLKPLLKAYEEGLVNVDREVRVLDPKGEYEGVAKGITPQGELIVAKKDGGEVHVGNGEISVRGVMGYV